MTRLLSAFALFLIFLSSCETEIDLNAPYTKYTTVYGLLDLSADTQVVRINKSFLGEGSALDFAQVKDSSEYPLDAVEAFIRYGNDITVPLTPYNMPNREPGAFYDENILVYITDQNLATDNQGNPVDLSSTSPNLADNYELVVRVDGKEITSSAEPTVLNTSSMTSPLPNNYGSGGSLDTRLVWVELDGQFSTNTKVNMKTTNTGMRYESKILFNYKEHFTDGSVANRTIELPLTPHTVPYNSGGQAISRSYSPEYFFQYLKNNVECDGQVAYRTIDSCAFVMSTAGKDLTQYIEVNSPVTGVVTERPEYSNIEGENAFGLFSSRFTYVRKKWFKSSTLNEFYGAGLSTYTADLCFCDPAPGATYPCPSTSDPCDCE